MLIHKATLGAISHVWNADGTRLIEASFKSVKFNGCAELLQEEWWYVPSNSRLAREITQCYPDFDPILDSEGNLVEIRAHYLQRIEERRRQRKEEIERLKADARTRGYEKEFRGHRNTCMFGDAISQILANRAGIGECAT